ncbi:hypothetical protein KSP39_PZI014487 [Platanthera zijinensis]|uniref:Uncharacterized protein n=1 Tax=Platanthera zijinensis TaxID=2320716 RepID=A0AAP0BAE5_9ASPA
MNLLFGSWRKSTHSDELLNVHHGISSGSSKAVENEALDEDLHRRGSFNLVLLYRIVVDNHVMYDNQ